MKPSTMFVAIALYGAHACQSVPAQTSAVGDASTIDQAGENQVLTLAVESNADFDTTLRRLYQAIATRGLSIVTSVEHSKSASAVGMDLAPSTLVIFGNPKAGTRLMQESVRMGLELPLKMLVYQVGDRVYVGYKDIIGTAAEYDIAPTTAPLPQIAQTLGDIAVDAANGVGEKI